ncbi:hypothetical protein CKAH01_03656 [Colletotrichum kahawae]|uniref:Uncharacterized protein n=1 Tax=Colletotrichum kahawae TaxID=34407 RepID=A0AAD9YQP6_COLKA|nr:hypothetical protein CKAH01_03656 [Colletotrichum kahawae]
MERTCLLSATHPCLLPRLSSSSWTCVCTTHANRDHRKERGWGAQPTKPFPFPCSSHLDTPQIALPTKYLPASLPRYRGSTNTPTISSYRQMPSPPTNTPFAARLGHLVISVFESPSDLGASRPTTYQQVPCWTTEAPYLFVPCARFLSASDEHDDYHPHDLTRPFLPVPRSNENSNMSASPYLRPGGMLVSGKSTLG